jgi:hypothetical protein
MSEGLQKLFPHHGTVKERYPEDGPKQEAEETQQRGSRPTEPGNTAQDVGKRLLASHAKSLQPANMSYSSCQGIGKERKDSHLYRVAIRETRSL